MALIQTPSQTVGPFFAIGLPWSDGPDVVPNDTPGAFSIRGTVYDGAGEPVPDALVETWQADPAGRFDHPIDPRGRVPGSAASAARPPTPRAAGACARSSRAACPTPTAARRRPTSS